MNKKFTFNFTNGDSISCSLDEWTDDDRDYYRSDESKFLYRLRAALYSNEPMSIGNDSHKAIINSRNISYIEIDEIDERSEAE